MGIHCTKMSWGGAAGERESCFMESRVVQMQIQSQNSIFRNSMRCSTVKIHGLIRYQAQVRSYLALFQLDKGGETSEVDNITTGNL